MAIIPEGTAPMGTAAPMQHPFFAHSPLNAQGSEASPWIRALAMMLGTQNPQAYARMAMNRGLQQQQPVQPPVMQPRPEFMAQSGAVPTALPPVMQPRPDLFKGMAPPVMPPLAPAAPAAPPMQMHPEIAARLAAMARPQMPAGPMPTAASSGFGMPNEARNPFAQLPAPTGR